MELRADALPTSVATLGVAANHEPLSTAHPCLTPHNDMQTGSFHKRVPLESSPRYWRGRTSDRVPKLDAMHPIESGQCRIELPPLSV